MTMSMLFLDWLRLRKFPETEDTFVEWVSSLSLYEIFVYFDEYADLFIEEAP